MILEFFNSIDQLNRIELLNIQGKKIADLINSKSYVNAMVFNTALLEPGHLFN